MGYESISGPNWIVPTAPAGDSSNRVADTQFVATAIAAGTTGFVLQTVYNETTTLIAFTTTMAAGSDTVPVKTDGTQILSATITPFATGNTLLVRALAPVTNSLATNMWMAVFQDAANTALAAAPFGIALQNVITPASLAVQLAAGTTGPTTFKINVGNFNTVVTTWTVNGIANTPARRLGGASRATLTIVETKV